MMSSGDMTWEEHWRELKRRVLVCLIVLVVAFGIGFGLRVSLLSLVLELGEQTGYRLVYLAPEEVLVQQVKMALGFSLVATIPVMVTQAVLFVMKGKERVAQWGTLIFGLLACLFYLVGVWFGAKVLVPITLTFLSEVSQENLALCTVSVEKFVSFVMTVLVGAGIVFEIPVLSAIGAVLGFVTAATLRKFRSVAVVVIFVVAAIITPPDVVSQFVTAIPMVMLYEISVVVVGVISKVKRRKGHETLVTTNKET